MLVLNEQDDLITCYICTGRDFTQRALDRKPLRSKSVSGIFCAGAVPHGPIKRIASDVGEGSMSTAFMHKYLGLSTSRLQANTQLCLILDVYCGLLGKPIRFSLIVCHLD